MRLQGLQGGDHDPNDVQFANWLSSEVGQGVSMLEDMQAIPLPPCINIERSEESLISWIYNGIHTSPPPPPAYFLNRAILAARNSDVHDLNHVVLERMSTTSRTYFSIDSVLDEPEGAAHFNLPITPEFLRSITTSSLPPGELILKPGCPVILLRNLSPKSGLCNGSRMIVDRTGDRVLQCTLIGGDHHGDTVFIPRIGLYPSDAGAEYSFVFRRLQFPVRLAFAMSINKAQGQSCKYVGVNLRNPVFAHGQLYVALSRATSASRLKILLDPHTHDELINVVHKEVLI